MIAGLHKGKDFAPLVRYVFHGRHGHQAHRGIFLGGSILAGNPEDLLAFFQRLQALRPDVINPVHHVHISLAPGETLAIHQWLRVAEEVAQTLRWSHWAVVGHEDSAQEHTHLIGTRLSEGRVYSERLRDMRLLMKCLRKLEKEFGLRQVETPVSARSKHGRVRQDARRPNRERAMAREGKVSHKQALRNAIDDVIAAGFRNGGVLLELQRRGYEPYTTWRNGHPVGICWMDAEGRRFPGARLGPGYAGRRFFERIGGGFHGETRHSVTVHPERLRAYDTRRRWNHIVRELDRQNGPVAGTVAVK